jgi:hypothetical protein
MIGTTAVLLGRTAIDSPWAAAILLASLLLLLRWNVHRPSSSSARRSWGWCDSS